MGVRVVVVVVILIFNFVKKCDLDLLLSLIFYKRGYLVLIGEKFELKTFILILGGFDLLKGSVIKEKKRSS